MEIAVQFAQRFWEVLEDRDWTRLTGLLDPQFIAIWPQSGEQYNREGFITVNRLYPGDWHIHIRNVLGSDIWAVTEIDVEIDGRLDRAVSFFRVHDDRIIELREYWPEQFPIPGWRRDLNLVIDKVDP